MLAQIEAWRKELVNLARSNRLLNFKDTRSSTLGIVAAPDELNGIVGHLLAGKSWEFFTPPDSDDEGESFAPALIPRLGELLTDKDDRAALTRTLRNLDRRATQEFMDKGLWILYLAAGFLKWVDPDSKDEAVSPLLLIPVELHRESPREPYELVRVDEEIVVNPALALKLAEFGLTLPELDDPDEFDLDDYFDQVRNHVRSMPTWSVTPRLVVSHFSFHKEVMYRDLQANAEQIADHPIVGALVHGTEEGSSLDFEPMSDELIDKHGRPEHGATVLPADATQRQCITASAAGNSFVMDGPPGTGKSQTIANMIAENIASGRTVLFVSEKAAALEVVETRMRQVGLGDYTLELHSHKATRKEVAHELARALTHHPQAPPAMLGSELNNLARRRAELSARAAAVNEIREPLGRSLNNVIGRVTQLQDRPQAPHPEQIGVSLSPAEFADVISTAEGLSRAWGPISRGPSFVWRDLDNVTLNSATRQRVDAQVESAEHALERLFGAASDITDELGLELPRELPGYRRIVLLLEHLGSPHAIPLVWLTEPDLDPIAQLRTVRHAQVERRAAEINELSTVVGERYRELPFGRLDDIEAHLRSVAKSSLGDTVSAMTRPQVDDLSTGLADTSQLFHQLSQRAASLAMAFALPEQGTTLERSRELGELGVLAASADKPEAAWLHPSSLAAAQHSEEVLQALVDSFKRQREELGKTFSDDVLGLDLAGLIIRFESVHQGFGKIKGGYRADKKAIAEVSRSGRFAHGAVTLLPQALEWQKLKRQLEEAESRHASDLGDYYYRGEPSDFESIERALGVARRAIELAGPSVDLAALQRQLARGGQPAIDIQANAGWILQAASSWLASADDQVTPALAADLVKRPVIDAAQLATTLQHPLDGLSEVLAAVDAVTNRQLTVDEAVAALSARTRLDQFEAELDAAMSDDQRRLGDGYSGAGTDWAALDSALEWTTDLRSLVDSEIDDDVAGRLVSAQIPAAELSEPLTNWLGARDAICGNFASGKREELQQDFMTTVDDARDLLHLLRDTLPDIDEWFEYSEARSRLITLGVQEPLEFCESQALDAELVPAVLERAVLERWADSVIEADKDRIGTVRADQLANTVEEFRRLDERVIELAASRVIRACNERRPRTTLGPAGVIQREGMKQRKHMPVRDLFAVAGPVVQSLKPCLMMTPLTVSQFLPPGFRFDVVIFDEASQVKPSDAINCIYRGDQLIVAGDEQQLPPTSFFDTAFGDSDDEYDEEDFAEFESVLKLCLGAGGLRQLPLRWHYRSQHEDLILYSNHSFYEGRLISFPGAVHSADDLGVELYHVEDGVYRRGTSRDNPREAAVAVDRMMHWAEWSQAHPSHAVTIGVVAFSEAQASAIEVELDRRRQARPDLDAFFQEGRLDGYFIKNLENVQGDERDVMIFSVGYGHDENHKFTMNFGPINRAGGQRRLNVAITRARRRVEVVSSVRSEDFPSNIAAEGVRHLHRYLNFAAKGESALALEIGELGLDAESPFEEEVIRVIRSWGYEAVPQVGAAGYRVDIGIPHPVETGRYALGVECDGAMYHSSRVARDRDRLRQDVLEGLGWRLHRIWGTSWYRDRAGQEERLREAIDAAIAGKAPAPRKRRLDQAPLWVEETYEVVAADERPPWAEPYVVATPTPPSARGTEMHEYGAQADFRRMIEEVVDVEGPVSRELVLRRVRESWGVGRAGARIREAFDEAIKTLRARGRIVESEPGFLMVKDGDASRVRIPDADNPNTRRPIDEVPNTELRAAIEAVVADAMQAGRDELTFAVARLYGWNRRGSDIAAALDRTVTYLIRMKRLAREDQYLRIARR